MKTLNHNNVRIWAIQFHQELCQDPTIPDANKFAFLKEMLFLLSLPKNDEEMTKALETTSKALVTFRLILQRLSASHEAIQIAIRP